MRCVGNVLFVMELGVAERNEVYGMGTSVMSRMATLVPEKC